MAECMPMTSFHDFHHNHRHASRFFNDMGIFPKHMSGEMSFNASLSLMPSEMSTEIDRIPMNRWKRRPIRQWSNDDLLDFIYTLASENRGIAVETFPGENFQGVNGEQLYHMTCQDFTERDPMHGKLIYECIHEWMYHDSMPYDVYVSCDFPSTVVPTVESKPNTVCDSSESRQQPQLPCRPRPLLPKPVEECISQDTDDGMMPYDYIPMNPYGRVSEVGVRGFDADIGDVPFAPRIVPSQPTPSTAADGLMAPTTHAHVLQPVVHQPHLWPDGPDSNTPYAPNSLPTYIDISQPPYCRPPRSDADYVIRHPTCAESPNGQVDTTSPTTKPITRKPQNRNRRHSSAEQNVENDDSMAVSRPKRPHISSRPISNRGAKGTSNVDVTSTSKKRSQSGKGGHLWEFIRHLLKTSESPAGVPGVAPGEKIIQWEDKAEGVFRIVNSKAVAKLWGEQKDNRKTKMTYEKLSRALRWCRTDGFLSIVPKDGRFPKKLCFKFGDKATNWRD